jgi:hypothetical protein
LGLVGVILTVLYTEIEADEGPAEQQEEAPPQEEGPQDEAREELAGP